MSREVWDGWNGDDENVCEKWEESAVLWHGSKYIMLQVTSGFVAELHDLQLWWNAYVQDLVLHFAVACHVFKWENPGCMVCESGEESAGRGGGHCLSCCGQWELTAGLS